MATIIARMLAEKRINPCEIAVKEPPIFLLGFPLNFAVMRVPTERGPQRKNISEITPHIPLNSLPTARGFHFLGGRFIYKRRNKQCDQRDVTDNLHHI